MQRYFIFVKFCHRLQREPSVTLNTGGFGNISYRPCTYFFVAAPGILMPGLLSMTLLCAHLKPLYYMQMRTASSNPSKVLA